MKMIGEGRRIFLLTVLYNNTSMYRYNRTVSMYFIDPNNRSTVIERDYNIRTVGTEWSISSFSRQDHLDIEGILWLMSYHSPGQKIEHFWFDPFTTRDVQRRRLIGCDVPEPSLWEHTLSARNYVRDPLSYVSTGWKIDVIRGRTESIICSWYTVLYEGKGTPSP